MLGAERGVETVRATAVPRALRLAAAILLVVIAYIHVSLLVDLLGLSSRLGVLFALDVLALVVAAAGILAGRRWLGWVLALVVAVGSAAARLGGTADASVQHLLMGSGVSQLPSTWLPMLAGVNTLGDVAVTLELIVAVLSTYALLAARGAIRL